MIPVQELIVDFLNNHQQIPIRVGTLGTSAVICKKVLVNLGTHYALFGTHFSLIFSGMVPSTTAHHTLSYHALTTTAHHLTLSTTLSQHALPTEDTECFVILSRTALVPSRNNERLMMYFILAVCFD
jgi:hypothetical protein